MKKRNKPVIFWHSDPICPDETLVLSGGNFDNSCTVELEQLDSSGNVLSLDTITPAQVSDHSLKVIIPAGFRTGIYRCKVAVDDSCSDPVFVNAVDAWWILGDISINSCRQNGWLRIQGKCLSLAGTAQVYLKTQDKKDINLDVDVVSSYSLKALIPEDIVPGSYELFVDNGFGVVTVEIIRIAKKETPACHTLNVVEFGADPTGKKDCTLAIVQATERLAALGGGIVYFPGGRYRIDSILRSGTWINSSIKIPQNVSFKGAGKDLVSLWWPDREEPLPSLLEGSNNFTIEDLSIYTQGRHSTIITGENNVRIKNVCIRANCYYMTMQNGEQAHHGRKFEGVAATGAAFHIWGDNVYISDCDIYTSALCFDLKHCHGGFIANNTIRANNLHFFSGCSELIFENNSFSGNQLTTGGSNIAMHMGASVSKHIYYADNIISHIYGGDHEALTLDGHATAYLGRIKNISGISFDLAGERFPKSRAKGSMGDMYGTVVAILDGQGKGQYRWLNKYENNHITIDRPWDLEPDNTSIVTIGGFNGLHLFIRNTMQDTGTIIQLYPPNFECIIAENKSIRASNINSLGKFGKNKDHDFVRVEPSWYNQYLDNHTVVGNAWGGGCTEIDRWIGGESMLNIWGWQVYYYSINGADYDRFLRCDELADAIGEKKERERTIPISSFQIVRRHKIDNNSSIRIRGAVSDVLIEKCLCNKSARGIRVDCEIDYKQPKGLGQLFDFDAELDSDKKDLYFLSPSNVLLRDNSFQGVGQKYSGNVINDVLIMHS